MGNMQSRGFSLIEVLIASLVTGFLVIMAYSAIAKLTQRGALESAKNQARIDLRVVMSGIGKDFAVRDLTPVAAVPASAFNGSATVPCQGILLRQSDPVTGAPRTIRYFTQCLDYVDPVGKSLLPFGGDVHAHPASPDLICGPKQIPQLVAQKTVGGTTTTQKWPDLAGRGVTSAGVSVCFRFAAASSIEVEGGWVYFSGNQSGLAYQKLILSTSDRSTGIQYLAPK